VPHLALLGPPPLLEVCGPASAGDIRVTRLAAPTGPDALVETGADVVVAFDPSPADRETIDTAALPTLVWWSATPPATGARATNPRIRTIADPLVAPDDAWRTIGLPVADVLFSSPSRTPATTIAVNLHDGPDPARVQRALTALAQGRLLISEPLTPTRGLEPGIDYIEGRLFEDLQLAVENAVRRPDAFTRMRLRGRRKAELFRSSTVIARLAGDLLLELGGTTTTGERS
jgi:hypothetical protein